MNRYKRLIASFLSIILFFGLSSNLFAANDSTTNPSTSHVEASPTPASASVVAPTRSLRNNSYYLESVRLTGMAETSYDEGDYDAATDYAKQALVQADLSDAYVAAQLKAKQVEDAIAAAKAKIEWAEQQQAASRFPEAYTQAKAAYEKALEQQKAGQLDDALASAQSVLTILAVVTEAGSDIKAALKLPQQYTVRPWAISKDCYWNIAGRSWVYNDPLQWRTLYEANKDKMPDPNNPDLIHPGMIIDIPSLNGETRSGMWQEGETYDTFTR
jgi:nucleoid-associated protein YgaU